MRSRIGGVRSVHYFVGALARRAQRRTVITIPALFLLVLGMINLWAAPPYSGTIFLDPDIIKATNPTTFQTIANGGRGERTMFDRRVNGWVSRNAFLFVASYEDAADIEIQVNPEFATPEAARVEASKYAPVIGRLPACLRTDVETVWIHRGTEPFGGGNNNLLIHIGQAALYEADGILEETLVHEAAHTSLDAAHARAPGWIAAQAADGEFISTYARDNPQREDVAETFLPYLALRHRRDQISREMAVTVNATVPNRMEYFDSLDLDLHPFVPRRAPRVDAFHYDPEKRVANLEWESVAGRTYDVNTSSDLIHWEPIVSALAASGDRTSYSFTNPIISAETFFTLRNSKADSPAAGSQITSPPKE